MATATTQCGPCFNVGDKVNHVANCCGLFPEGTGVVTEVIPWNTGDGYSYRVKCDTSGNVLPVNFKAEELNKIS